MPKLLQDLSFPAIMAGFITCMIGISVSAVLVIEAAQSLGANAAQISSWLWVLGIGVSGFLLSWKYRYPISTAWSTAGLALVIASAGHYSLGEAIGDFRNSDCWSGFFWNFRANFPVYSTKSHQCHAGRYVIKIWYHSLWQPATVLGIRALRTGDLSGF